MAEMDVYEVEEKVPSKRIDIQYRRPKTYRRVFARIIDLLLLLLVGVLLFLGLRAIVNNTQTAKDALARIDETMIESGVYVEVEGEQIDLIQYLDSQSNLSDRERMERLRKAIEEKFFVYAEKNVSAEDYSAALKDYDDFRLSLSYQDIPLFVEKDGDIVMNPEASFGSHTYDQYCDLCYEPFLDEHVRGYLVTIFPQYLADTRYFSNMIIFLEVPVAVLVGSFLVYLLPPLILRRNRQTIGLLVYRIGMADANLFCIPWKKYLAYDMVFIFGIIVLSFFTLAIPLIVSTTMMAFSKQKQDFPEYMFQFHEIDVSADKIYHDYGEIELEHSAKNKKPVEFRNITGE